MDPDIVAHYTDGGEQARLAGWSLERLRTEELLAQSLPSPPARVLDVGGGPGRYALWLAALGYDVVLLDPVELHTRQARQAAAEHPTPPATEDRRARSTGAAPVEVTVECGDARNLPHPGNVFDAVLMLGPLYHLTDRADRAGAIAEALRVARPGGLLAAAGVSRAASLLDGFASEHHADEPFRAAVELTVATGQHRNPSGRPDWFTTAYFHRPGELRAELDDAGVEATVVHGVEGPGWLWGDRGAEGNEHWRAIALWAARLVETDPDYTALSAHLLALGHKPSR